MDEKFLIDGANHTDDHENNSSPSNVDRFHKRLEVYRTHSNDCKIRIDQTSEEIQEQHNNEISVLQSKSNEQKNKKRTNRKGLMRHTEQSVNSCQKSPCQTFVCTYKLFFLLENDEKQAAAVMSIITAANTYTR